MANKKFSELTPVTTLDGTEYTPVIQAATNKTATIGNILGDTTGAVGRIKFKAGGATALTAPIKLISATLNTNAEPGAIEFLTDAYYGTITTASARKTFAFLESPTFTGTVGGITASMVGAAPSNHSLLSTTHGDTLTDTVVRGDIIYGNATPKWARLAIGTVGKVLQSDGTDIGWSASALGTAAYTASTAYEVPLTFNSGVTRTVNAVANDLITGKSGGQTAIGGTGASENLTWSSTSHSTIGSVNVGTIAKGENLNIQATEGAELAPALTGNSGVNWTLSSTTGYTQPFAGTIDKTGDGTGTITTVAATTIVAGTTYKVVIVVSAISGSTAFYTLGGISGTNLTAATTYTDYITASTTGKIIITPVATGLRITITSISIKALTDATGDLSVFGNLKVYSPIEGGNTPSSYITYKGTTGIGLTTGIAHQWLGGTNGGTVLATLLNNSRFGIGTVIPTNTLYVEAASNGIGGITLHGTSNPAITLVSSATVGYAPVIVTSAGSFFNDAGINDMGYRTESTRILFGVGPNNSTMAVSGNNIGIGTITPTANFQVVQRPATANLGTVSTPGNSTTLTGVGTQFLNTFKIGDSITVAGETVRTILTITSNTVLDVSAAFSATPRATVAYTLTGGIIFSVLGNGRVGFNGITAPTAMCHLPAGTATAGTAPAKLTSGPLLATPEAGAIEFLTDGFYGTITTSAVRRMFVLSQTGRATAQTAANASVHTFTLPATDGSYQIAANVLVTTSSAEAFTVTCAYTDEGNTARTATLNFQLVAGTIGTNIAFANGAVPYMGIPFNIRCKASTAITIATTGTFTGCTYNVEAFFKKLA